MAKKIEAWVGEEAQFKRSVVCHLDTRWSGDRAVTLVIHEGKPERVFTHSEVKAYVKELFMAQFDPGSFTERYVEMHPKGGYYSYEETVPQWIFRAKSIVRKKHGISTEQE